MLYIFNVVQEIPIKIPFKCDDVTASIKRQIMKTWYFISRGKFSKCQFLVCFLWVSVTKHTLKIFFAVPYDSDKSCMHFRASHTAPGSCMRKYGAYDIFRVVEGYAYSS